MGKDALWNALRNKNDEFYTSYEDIESMLSKHPDFFQNRNVYCNCDSDKSNFYVFFIQNFKKYNLKSLTCTCYNSQFSPGEMWKTYDGVNIQHTVLKGNGSFSSNECLNELEKCDIVITNPPFSKARLFVDILYEYEKDFLIICSNIFFTYKVMNDRIVKHKMFMSKELDLSFENTNQKVMCRWYTNIQKISDLKELDTSVKLDLNDTKSYERVFDKRCKLSAICVNRVKKIPFDYYDLICVPITVFDYDWEKYFDFVSEFWDALSEKDQKNKFVRICLKRKQKECPT